MARTYLTGTGRVFAGLDERGQPVKFHVSEPVRKSLNEIAAYHDSNLSVIMRSIIFATQYGSYDLQQWDYGKVGLVLIRKPCCRLTFYKRSRCYSTMR